MAYTYDFGQGGGDENPLALPFQFVASPFVGLIESLGDMGVPGFEQLAQQPFLDPVYEFQEQHPFMAGVGEFASYFVPYAGWAKATKAVPALRGLAAAGARLGGTSPGARFALGETARYAPLSAGITGFDYAAGKYESPWEALGNFAVGTAMGAPLASAAVRGSTLNQLLAHTPVLRDIGDLKIPGTKTPIGEAATNLFGPTPDERAMYGMPEEVRNAVAPALVREVGTWDQLGATQQTGRKFEELLAEINAGARTDIPAEQVQQYIRRYREAGFQETLGQGQSYVNTQVGEKRIRDILNAEFRPGTPSGGGGRREQLRYGTGYVNDVEKVAGELNLPEGWELMGQFYRHRRSYKDTVSRRLRMMFGLNPEARGSLGFRRVQRLVETPDGDKFSQIWGIRQERPGGMWIMATELPRHVAKDPSKGQNFDRFLYFKTDKPEFFFPEESAWARAIDKTGIGPAADEKLVGSMAFRTEMETERGASELLDRLQDLKQWILSPANFRAFIGHMLQDKGSKSALLGRFGESEEGLRLGRVFEHYIKPLKDQFRHNPEASYVVRFYQAVFDAMEGLAHRTVFGERRLSEGKSVLSQIIGGPRTATGDSIDSMTEEFFKLENADEMLTDAYRFVARGGELEDLPDGPAKAYLQELDNANVSFMVDGNSALHQLGMSMLPTKKGHIGVSNNFEILGHNFVPILDRNAAVIGLGAGKSAAQAKTRANQVLKMLEGEGHKGLSTGPHFTATKMSELPRDIQLAVSNPGFLRERTGLRGFKWDLESINKAEWKDALFRSYESRAKLFGERLAKGLTERERARIARFDPSTDQLLTSRLNQMIGVSGPFTKFQNQVFDNMFSGVFGPNSATKAAGAMNTLDYQWSLGMGNLGFPALNIASVLQTTLAELAMMRGIPVDWMARFGYLMPMMSGKGKPSGWMGLVTDPWKSLGRGMGLMNMPIEKLEKVDARFLPTMERLADEFRLGPRYIEEFLGQAAGRRRAILEGVEKPEQLVERLEALSNYLPGVSEKIARTWTASAAMDMLTVLEKVRGVQYTPEQFYHNVKNAVDRTQFLYAPFDRPKMFTSPLGSLFGARKNWFVNYLFNQLDYFGLAQKGKLAPLLFTLGGTAGLGGLFALPLAPQIADWYTETFNDKDLMEAVYERFGEGGGNMLSFGLPAALGASFSGATSAPGADFFGDAEFLGSFVSLRRPENMLKNLWLGMDQMRMGLDPMGDPVFRQQLARWAAPGSMYRFMDVLDGDITAPTTGRPMVRDLKMWPDVLMQMSGFTSARIERERQLYERMLRDKSERQRTVQLFGEAYYRASLENDQDMMMDILRTAEVRRIDVSSIMQSAAKRARDDQVDMFGRRIPKDVLERYPETLGVSGE